MLANTTLFVCLLTIIPIGSANSQVTDYIYWVEPTKIRRANLDGTGSQDLVTGFSDGTGIALDLTNNHIYWLVEYGVSGKIRRANIDGSDPQDHITGVALGIDIALDITNGHIYWTNNGTSKIRRANIDGTNPQDHVIMGNSGEGICRDFPDLLQLG